MSTLPQEQRRVTSSGLLGQESPPETAKDWMAASLVAEVTIMNIEHQRWNTPTGSAPAESDPPQYFRIYHPVEVSVQTMWKSPYTHTITHFALANQRVANTSGGPFPMRLPAIGQTGVVFLYDYGPLRDINISVPLMDWLRNRSLVLSGGAVTYHPAAVGNWYLYDGETATSVIDGRTVTVSELWQEIQAGR